MKRLFALSLLMWVCRLMFSGPALCQSLSAPDSHAISTLEAATGSIKSLAVYLAGPFDNTHDQARAIFRWVAENISYDVGLFEGKPTDATPEGTLRRRKSVCEGYASLFKALCDSAGIDSVEVISGYAKGISYAVGQEIETTNHSWNAIRIDGRWQLLDVTWAAGYCNGGKFVKMFDNHYWLTPPDKFVFDHLPENLDWQLLGTPLTKQQFESLPNVRSTFWACGLEFFGTQEGTISVASGPLNLSIRAEGASVLCDLLSSDQNVALIGHCPVKRQGSLCQILIELPRGQQQAILRIYAKKGEPQGKYWWACDLRVVR